MLNLTLQNVGEKSIQSLAVMFLFWATISCKGKESAIPMPQFTGILQNMKAEHPRLMLSDERTEDLKALRKTDPILNRYINDVVTTANGIVLKAPLQRVLIGPRLWAVSRELYNRTTHLALAYRLTGEKKYLNSAVDNMKTVCGFSDWNPSHFLDVAEMTAGVALGYDWLYNDLSQADRETIRSGLKSKGMDEYKKVYSTAWWAKSENNWNQVCNGALIMGTLALAETDPEYAQEFVPKALLNLPNSNKFYAPDGAWYEGPGYWAYATEYLSFAMSALQSATGNMGNLEKVAGLSQSGLVPMICAGPTNYILNFSDSSEDTKATTSVAMFFLANTYNNPVISNYLHNLIKTTNALAKPFHVVWYKAPTSDPISPPLDYFLRGDVNELVFMRSSWTDPNALWMGIKSGINSSSHSHLDLGNFELDAGGVRWARDLGSDDYNLPDYWAGGVGGKRWRYYRLNSFSHNVPLLGNKNQYEVAKSKFIQTNLNIATPTATVDLTEAYRDFSSKSTRKVSMVDNRKAFLMEDDFAITKPTEVAWGMTTENQIEIIKGGKAILRDQTITTQTLEVEIVAPIGAEFTVESAVQKAPEKLNTGNSRLMLRLPNQSGQVKVVVKFTPKMR